MAKLTEGFKQLAKRLQEALELSHADICKTLSDELRDMYPGQYAYVMDVFGDAESGDVVYCCGGETWKAPYEIQQTTDGKRMCSIDDDEKVNVLPRTVYDEEADDDDGYADMSEAQRKENFFERFPGSEKWPVPILERFISKKERDAADSGDFAGKGKSFPILKPTDVMAAVRSMGRAGSDNKSTSALKASIIRIAKKKGWTKYLPKAWRDGEDASESGALGGLAELKLVEGSSAFLEEIPLREARTNYPIKLISPGTGTSAHYPAEVLERDGPKVFKAGTLMFWNHPTAAEESARPEGNLDNLAAITTSDAKWDANGKKGPGLYAEAKVMADYAQKVEERAPHIGLSIRAGGSGSGKTVNGKPELKSIDYAESVDYVTKAGRGGLALAEAARDAGIPIEENDMDEQAVKKLIESAVKEAVTTAVAAVQSPVKLLEARALKGDAVVEANRILAPLALHESSKARVVAACIENLPMKEGALDTAKFTELVTAKAREEAAYVASLAGHQVTGMGIAPIGLSESDEKARRKAEKKRLKEARKLERQENEVFASLTGLPIREVKRGEAA